MSFEKLTRCFIWKKPSYVKYTEEIHEGKDDFNKILQAFQNSWQNTITDPTVFSEQFCDYFQGIIDDPKKDNNKEPKEVITKLNGIYEIFLKKEVDAKANQSAMWLLSLFQSYGQYLTKSSIEKIKLGKVLDWIKPRKAGIGNLFGVPLDKRSITYMPDDSNHWPLSFATMFRLTFGLCALLFIWMNYFFYTSYPTESSADIMKKIEGLQEIMAEDRQVLDLSPTEVSNSPDMNTLREYRDDFKFIRAYEVGIPLFYIFVTSVMLVLMGIPLAIDKHKRNLVPGEVNQIVNEIDKMINDLEKRLQAPSLGKVIVT